MLRVIATLAVLFCFFGTCEAQIPPDIFKTLRNIRLLETNRVQLEEALNKYKLGEVKNHRQSIDSEDFDIEVIYTTSKCADDPDGDFAESWAVDEWRVAGIEFDSFEPMKISDLELDLAKFKKEQKYSNDEDSLVYHDKASGISIEVDEDDVDKISFFPPRSMRQKLCPENKSLRDFYRRTSWFDTKLKDRVFIPYCPTANVESVEFSLDEIVGATSSKLVTVTTQARDPENDPLIYVYIVSAGQIRGTGPKVVWDLTGVPAGTYTLTAGVDDGCGLCGKTYTKQIVIR